MCFDGGVGKSWVRLLANFWPVFFSRSTPIRGKTFSLMKSRRSDEAECSGRNPRILIFGCGVAGRNAFRVLKARGSVIGFADSDGGLHGTEMFGLPVWGPDQIRATGFDRICVASMYHRQIRRLLVDDLGIDPGRIDVVRSYYEPEDRETWRLMCSETTPSRPVLFLEEYQWAWMRLPMDQVYHEGLSRGIVFGWHQVRALDREPAREQVQREFYSAEVYRGVSLFPAVRYSLCVELEVSVEELDFEDPNHSARAAWWFAVARQVVDELHGVFSRRAPVAVLAVQGHFVSASVARQMASVFGFQFFACENTFFPSRMICEPFTGSAVNETSAATIFRMRRGAVSSSDGRSQLAAFLRELEAGKSPDHTSPADTFVWPESRKRIVFLGQCYTDSSVLFGSREGINAVSVVRALIEYAATRSVFVLAKLHPKESSGLNPLETPYNRLTWRKLLKAGFGSGSGEGGGEGSGWLIDHDNRTNTAALLRGCDTVVTINSQGGLEALAHGKSVLVLGRAFYSNLGLTIDVPSLASLPAMLDDVLSGKGPGVDFESVAGFLRVYLHEYCVERTPKKFVAAVKDRLQPDGEFVRAYGSIKGVNH